VSTESTAFTVTLNIESVGTTTVNLSSSDGGDVFHSTAGGETVGAITIVDGQTTQTFYLLPDSTVGVRTITPTATGVIFTPTTLTYTTTQVEPDDDVESEKVKVYRLLFNLEKSFGSSMPEAWVRTSKMDPADRATILQDYKDWKKIFELSVNDATLANNDTSTHTWVNVGGVSGSARRRH
jgi:hypothetical protein